MKVFYLKYDINLKTGQNLIMRACLIGFLFENHKLVFI
jgi:hypothetical protein